MYIQGSVVFWLLKDLNKFSGCDPRSYAKPEDNRYTSLVKSN